MHVIIACDSFKGCLSSKEIAGHLAAGVRRVFPHAAIDAFPTADGGEGTLDAFLNVLPGKRVQVPVQGPLGDEVEAGFALLEDGTAIIEMAAASGLTLVPPERLDPLRANTFGTGQLIREALDRGCGTIILGLGGSATNDAGTGMARALGARFLDGSGKPLEGGGGELHRLHKMDLSGLDPRLSRTRFIAACDVTNPLCGPQGASAVYGPQKGAAPEMVRLLDEGLARFAQAGKEATGRDVRDVPGSGAAGGLGAALLLFCSAKIQSGITTLLDVSGFDECLRDADLVLTGEGRLDGQSACGKVPSGVAKRVKRLRPTVPVVAVAGAVAPGSEALYQEGVDAMFSIAPGPISLEDSMASCGALLEDTAERILRLTRAAKGEDRPEQTAETPGPR